ncbi:hypothetical protein DNTS_012205 [Danionella cerebrum]|uniref:Chemokine interleukin-8-like domain-containing protein n=1 Tax=Danionella cerebrum TaxID=2873325 RepID=A0A553QZM0_9TELE|nr:hypothetical protein DNTS_012205 [Danionella translucida]
MKNFRICAFCFILLLNFLMESNAHNCCVSYTKRPRRCAILKGYDIQGITGKCDLPAIIFHPKTGKPICANPSHEWTQKAVQCLKMMAKPDRLSLLH